MCPILGGTPRSDGEEDNTADRKNRHLHPTELFFFNLRGCCFFVIAMVQALGFSEGREEYSAFCRGIMDQMEAVNAPRSGRKVPSCVLACQID